MKKLTALLLQTAFIGATVLASLPARAEDTITLKLAHFLPTANGMHSDFMEPWARELEACSNGKVKVDIYPGGTQLGNIAKLYDEARAGLIDIGQGVAGIPGGRFERLRIAELPFVFDNAGQASKTIWKLYPEYFPDEFPGVKILALHAHNPGGFHMVSKDIKSPDDLKGLRMRFPTGATKAMLEAFDATPVGLPPGEVYESAQKGVIDGTVFTWDTMSSFKLGEVLKHHVDAKAYVTTFWFGMNQKTYDGLPDDVRACVDEISGDTLVDKFGDWWNDWDKAGHEAASGSDHTIVELTPDERNHWSEMLKPMVEGYLKDLEGKGISNAKDIYEAMKKTAAGM